MWKSWNRCGMLDDATCFKSVYIVCEYTHLRSGRECFAVLIETQTESKCLYGKGKCRSLTSQQFRWLMEGLTVILIKSVRPVELPDHG